MPTYKKGREANVSSPLNKLQTSVYKDCAASVVGALTHFPLVGNIMFLPEDFAHAIATVLYPKWANLENGI
jgi:hypothetical protein